MGAAEQKPGWNGWLAASLSRVAGFAMRVNQRPFDGTRSGLEFHDKPTRRDQENSVRESVVDQENASPPNRRTLYPLPK